MRKMECVVQNEGIHFLLYVSEFSLHSYVWGSTKKSAVTWIYSKHWHFQDDKNIVCYMKSYYEVENSFYIRKYHISCQSILQVPCIWWVCIFWICSESVFLKLDVDLRKESFLSRILKMKKLSQSANKDQWWIA